MADKTKKTEKLNIYQRISNVMGEVKYIQKGDKKVNGQYTFVSHDAVTAAVHPHFLEQGIVMVPSVASWSVDGNRTSVDVKIKFVNKDDPADFISIMAFGFGIDPQDKGPGKAISYAVKYALLKVLCLETGDDPERDNIDHEPEPKAADFDYKVEASRIKAALEKCTTFDDLAIEWDINTDEINLIKKASPDKTGPYMDTLFDELKDAIENPEPETETKPAPSTRADKENF